MPVNEPPTHSNSPAGNLSKNISVSKSHDIQTAATNQWHRSNHRNNHKLSNKQWYKSKTLVLSNTNGNTSSGTSTALAGKKRKITVQSNFQKANNKIRSRSNVDYTKINNIQNVTRPHLKWVKEDAHFQSNLNDSLQDTLQSYGLYESNEGSQKRRQVLDELEQLLCDWATSVVTSSLCNSTDKSTSEDLAPDPIPMVRLVSFGSYRLGVHNATSDLDVLALCPPSISRDDFFSSLVEILKLDQRIKGLHPVPGAFTPIIKFFMSDIKIDLLFVRLADGNKLQVDSNMVNQDSLKERHEFELNDSMIIGLDEPSVRSLNGVRVAQFLLDTIPDKVNFRVVLLFVKKWATVHGLYSNVLGFLGGINWAILVAWICMRNPNASPPMLIKLFFQTFSRWRWPSPVLLVSISEQPPDNVIQLSVWNPKSNPRDRAHLMPILTPVYPYMNSSYNVGIPQKRRLCDSLITADIMMNQIANGTLPWSELLKGNDFFNDHGHYIEISIISISAKDHLKWFGLCESRLRLLIAGFESTTAHGCSAYPFAKFFTRTVQDVNEDNVNRSKIITSFFIGLEFTVPIDSVIDLKSCTDEFVGIVNNWEGRQTGMDLTIEHKIQEELPDYVLRQDHLAVDLEQLEIEEEAINI